MNEDQKKALENFMLDINCLHKLDKWKDNFNIFDVLKITHTEIRHSNILGWLLDPNENHHLGDTFLKAFICNILNNAKNPDINKLALLLQDFYTYNVLRESKNMDLVLVSRVEKTAYIIENKIWSSESKHQLKKYYDISKEEYPDYNIIYAFLTPDGKDASDTENWIPISYEEIIPLLEEAIKDVNINSDVMVLIKNYINAVRKEVMLERDNELYTICNEIYNKHRDALKLIYETIEVNQSVDSQIINEVLKEYAGEGKIIKGEDNSWVFFTKQLDNYLPELNDNISSYKSKRVYYYFFSKYENKVYIHFELGGLNLTEELTRRTNNIIEASKQLKNRVTNNMEYKYKKLFTKSLSINEEDYENSLKIVVGKLIDSALENEKKLMEIINQSDGE